MARAKKAKPPDSRMAFDFGDAPVRVKISEPEPAEKPLARSEGGVERVIREEAPTSQDDASNPGASAADEGPVAVPIDDTRPVSIEVDHAPDCACKACVTLRAEVGKVMPRSDPDDVAPVPTTSSDMSERSSKPGKQVGQNVRHLLRAAEDARRETAIASLVEAAEIALVRGKSREIHDMIITELRRRYRDSAERIEYHLRMRGIA